jgi:DNA-binding HxlR family transcriptional regulator
MKLEDCPVRSALKIIGGKWKPVIIYRLMEGKVRYGELKRLLPDVSQKMLTQQLRELERDGVLQRKVLSENPPHVEYQLSPHGRALRPTMRALCDWGGSGKTRLAAAKLKL